MIRLVVVGLGKMGLSHLSMARATPGVDVVGICDASGYLLGVLGKYTGLKTYSDYVQMLDELRPDAALIATPSKMHAHMVRQALERRIHVFCEKPFVLDSSVGHDLVAQGKAAGVVTQVGYHNRFVGAFLEVKRLLDAGAIGRVSHVLGEAYGPVVLKPAGSTWRSRRDEGGGCLYDYAAHPLNLLTWYLGEPDRVGGSVLNSVFSRDTDDEVFSTLFFPGGGTGQLSVNWSDESARKMTTRVTLWGTGGRIYADRQEIQVYLRGPEVPAGYEPGWNVRYTTDLTEPVAFYLRGEEYSAQLAAFARRIESEQIEGENDFASALVTDRVIEKIRADATGRTGAASALSPGAAKREQTRTTLGSRLDGVLESPVVVRLRDRTLAAARAGMGGLGRIRSGRNK